MIVIWTIKVKHDCEISFSNDGQSRNSCNDGKSLQNTSSGQSYLHIPNFSADDVGVYRCEAVYRGGSEGYNIDVGITVKRKAVFTIGSNINLTCVNKTWREMMFVIWTIKVKHACEISFANDGQSRNSCNDGKSLQNTSSAQSYLHIPNFSADDVGVYRCEAVYRGGSDAYNIDVGITAPPNISAWLEKNNKMTVAVCRAEKGNPVANISWSHTGNRERVNKTVLSDGFVTVVSHLELLEGLDPENLSCIVRHQSWETERILVLSEIKTDPQYKLESSHLQKYSV
ncbi:cell surface glycoprotein CD200 receptor 1-B-like [Xenentodon cancila]